MKKLMMLLLIAMVGVCFADYKTDFNQNLTDSAKIEKGLAEATQAKDLKYMDFYLAAKAFIGKDAKNITYDEYKKICKSIKFNTVYYPAPIMMPRIVFLVKRFQPFTVNILNDNTLTARELNSINVYFSSNLTVYNMIGDVAWRKRFVNIDVLFALSNKYDQANKFFNIYKKVSISLTPAEIKADTVLMKRAWYDKITDSDAWKQLLVKVELLNKSVQ